MLATLVVTVADGAFTLNAPFSVHARPSFQKLPPARVLTVTPLPRVRVGVPLEYVTKFWLPAPENSMLPVPPMVCAPVPLT